MARYDAYTIMLVTCYFSNNNNIVHILDQQNTNGIQPEREKCVVHGCSNSLTFY